MIIFAMLITFIFHADYFHYAFITLLYIAYHCFLIEITPSLR